jgi:hypothetical protein
MKFSSLSEYIVKTKSDIDGSLLKKLSEDINTLDEFAVSTLSKVQQKAYKHYKDGYIPDDVVFETVKYFTDLEVLNIEPNSEVNVNLAIGDKCYRFLTFLFVLNKDVENSTIHFHSQSVYDTFEKGDLYIFPPNFPYRFSIKTKNEAFKSVVINMCFST